MSKPLSAEGILLGVYMGAIQLSQKRNQTVGPKNDYYITIDQLSTLVENLQKIEIQ